MTNRVVVPCPDYATAQLVLAYARSRSDTTHCILASSKPPRRRGVMYSLVPGWVAAARRELEVGGLR
jgi:hypothetical protein